jgi:hypothetical protein
MSERRLKSLVQTLGDAGFASPYLDRLRRRMDVDQAQDDLECEVRREMAAALGRAEDKVNLALLELQVLEQEIEALREREGMLHPLPGRRLAAVVDAFNRQRERARRSLWELVIHREALGFRRNELLHEFYPIPPKKRKVEV